MQYEICFYTKTHGGKTLNIFIDGEPVYKLNGKYIWNGSEGTHRLRIEQVKMFKSKRYWVYAPLLFLMGVFAGDIEDFDDKTPFYAVYEADIFVDKNLEISVFLIDINRHKGESEKGFEYKIKVDHPKEVNIEVIKHEFSVTKKERITWFLMHFVLLSLIVGFVVFLCIIAGIRGLKSGLGIAGPIFLCFFSLLLIFGWILMICKLYLYSNGKYKKIKRI